MPEDNNTAEQELLKTIEGGDSSLAGKRIDEGQGGRIGEGKENIAFYLEQLKNKLFGFGSHLTPEQVNRGLIVLIGVLGLWYFFCFLNGTNRLKHIPKFEVSKSLKPGRGEKASVINLQPPEYYRNILLSRNIFMPFKPKKKVSVKTEKENSAVDLSEAVKNLKVVGISWSDKPQDRFVIIEDEKAKLTYFLQEGDTVSRTKLVVEKIFEDRAVLKFGKEEIDIR